jgi:hypothetical protein
MRAHFFTPSCNCCHARLPWDIPEAQYIHEKAFWDHWVCEACTPTDLVSAIRRNGSPPAFDFGEVYFCIVRSEVDRWCIGSGLSISNARALYRAGMAFPSADAANAVLDAQKRI